MDGSDGVVLHVLTTVILRLLAEVEDLLSELLVPLHEIGDELLVFDELCILGFGGGLVFLDLLLAAALLALSAE